MLKTYILNFSNLFNENIGFLKGCEVTPFFNKLLIFYEPDLRI